MDFEQYTWNPTVGPDQMAEQHSLIDDLFFGFEAPNINDLLMADAPQPEVIKTSEGRTRRVTISEITSEEESEWFMVAEDDDSSSGVSSEDEEVRMTTDQVFQMLDDSVQDWKMQLEVAVGDALKKLRKASKESKLKIKYLPGEGVCNKRLLAPKNDILKEWRVDYESAIQNVQNKLDKLARDKMAEVSNLYQDKLLAKVPKRTSTKYADPKKKITIDCRDSSAKKGGNHQALKQMARELDSMVAASQATTFDNCVPIYNLNPKQSCNVVAMPYEFPMQKYVKYLKETKKPSMVPNLTPKVDLKQFVANNQSKIMDALDDMKLKAQNKTQQETPKMMQQPNIKMAPLKKEMKRETSAMAKRGKMMERSEGRLGAGGRRQRRKKGDATITNQGYTYRLRQYSVNGEEHYLIVKKRIPSNEEVEDIFQDWKDNLRVKKVRRVPRVRKLSHRAQRKEYLKENSYPMPKTGPISYADALKKNLKFRPNYIPVEDVFDDWRNHLETSRPSSMEPQQPQPEQVLLQTTERTMEIHGCDEMYSAMECGQPTVRTSGSMAMEQAIKSTTTAAVMGARSGSGKKRKVLQPEHYFAAWRHNFNDEDFYPKRLPKQGKKYQVEEYFRVWRRNLYVKGSDVPSVAKRPSQQLRMMPENIFGDWLHHFNTKSGGSHSNHHHHHPHPPKYHHGANPEPVSKKSRNNNQRRSKNKKSNSAVE